MRYTLLVLLLLGCTMKVVDCPEETGGDIYDVPYIEDDVTAILWECDCGQYCADAEIETTLCSSLPYIDVVMAVRDRCVTPQSIYTTCVCETSNMVCKPGSAGEQ